MNNSKTLSQAIQAAQSFKLPRLEAQMLMLHALGRSTQDRAWLLAHDADELDASTLAKFMDFCARRAANEPIAYITGHKEFFGLLLKIDARVLDPRPDTETLVDWGLASLTGLPKPCVLDLGTGSGAVALALASELASQRREATVHASDASQQALEVARENAEHLGIPVALGYGNWFANDLPDQLYDLIVSNPPYIEADDPHLQALVHEPIQALVSGHYGLDDIRQIVQEAPAHLKPGGWLLLEHGYNQAEPVRSLLALAGFEEVQSRKDLKGIERCSGAKWPGGHINEIILPQRI